MVILPKPGVYPHQGPRDTESRAEREIYNKLRDVAVREGWYVWHLVRLARAEADFVIGAPGRGILLVEAKSGKVWTDGQRWYQNSAPLNEPPIKQAVAAASGIFNAPAMRRIESPPWEPIAIFPDSEISNFPTNADLAGRLIGAREMEDLPRALRAQFGKPHMQTSGADDRWIRAIHELWGDAWADPLRLGNVAAHDGRKLVTLDSEQVELIGGVLSENNRVLVSGPAGCGKTIVAMKAASKLAQDGKRVLVICFTEALAKWLQEQSSERVTVRAIKRLAAQLLREAGREVDEPERSNENPKFWDTVTRRALDEGADAILDARWDAVIVDEAQDLDANDWDLVELLAGDRPLWVFTDPSQRYWRDREIPTGKFFKFPLKRQYRTHKTILALASRYATPAPPGRVDPRDEIRRGVEEGRIKVIAVANRDDVEGAIAGEISNLTAQGLERAQIAAISLVSGRNRGSIAGLSKIGNYALMRADDPAMVRAVVGDSTLRFKGLERTAVIVTDLSLSHLAQETQRAAMYIAITRAQSFLRIIDTAESLAKDPALRDLV